MKLLVETTGSFEFMVPETGEYIRFLGPTVVNPSSFVDSRVIRGEVRLIETLHDEATDEEYLEFLSGADGDHSLATAAFLSKYGVISSAAQSEDNTTVRRTRRKKVED